MTQPVYSAESTQLGMILTQLDHMAKDMEEIKADQKAHDKASTERGGIQDRLKDVENSVKVLLWVVRILGTGFAVAIGGFIVAWVSGAFTG